MPSEPTKEAREAAEAFFDADTLIPNRFNLDRLARALDQFAEKWREEAETAKDRVKVVEDIHKRILSWNNLDVARARSVLVQLAAQRARKGENGQRFVDAVDTLSKHSSQCKAEADALEQERDALRRDVEAHQARIADLDKQIGDREETVAALRRRVGELEDKLEASEAAWMQQTEEMLQCWGKDKARAEAAEAALEEIVELDPEELGENDDEWGGALVAEHAQHIAREARRARGEG